MENETDGTLGLIIILVLTGAFCLMILRLMQCKHFKKKILHGHTGMRCKYWCGEVSNYDTVEEYLGNGYVKLKDEIEEIHIDNVEHTYR